MEAKKLMDAKDKVTIALAMTIKSKDKVSKDTDIYQELDTIESNLVSAYNIINQLQIEN